MLFRKCQTSAISMVLISGIVLAMVATTYQWGAPLVEKSQTNSKIIQAQDLMGLIKQKVNEVALLGEQKSFVVSLDGTLEVDKDKNSILYSITTAGLGIGSFSYISLDSSTDAISYEIYSVNATTGGIFQIGGVDYSASPCAGSDTQVVINGTTYQAGGTLVPGYVIEHIDCSNFFDGQTVISGPEQEVMGILGTDEGGVVMAKTMYSGSKYMTQMRLAYRELDDLATLDGQKILIFSEGNSMASVGTRTITIRRGDVERTAASSKLGNDLVTTKVYVSLS